MLKYPNADRKVVEEVAAAAAETILTSPNILANLYGEGLYGKRLYGKGGPSEKDMPPTTGPY